MRCQKNVARGYREISWQNMVPSFFQMCLTMLQVSVIASVIFYEFAMGTLIGSSISLSIIANKIVAPTYKLASVTVRIMIYQIQIIYPGRGRGRSIQGVQGFFVPRIWGWDGGPCLRFGVGKFQEFSPKLFFYLRTKRGSEFGLYD